MDQYGQLSVCVARIEELKASLIDGKKRSDKVSVDVVKACREFEADQKVIHQKKVDRANAFRSLEEDVAAALRYY